MQITTNTLRPDAFLQLRRLLGSAKQSAAAYTAALLSDTVGMRPRGEFGILMYHRVVDAVAGQPFPTWNVTPRKFRAQLSGLLRRGFQAWPLRRVLAYQQRKQSIPKRIFVVTFDDGYENNYTQAFPILRDLRIPATIFLATAFLNSPDPLPSDDWSAKGKLGVPGETWRAMTNEQCREMQASGLIELAAHTHTHQDFRNRPEALTADLQECLAYLKDRFGLADATFAFPYGTKWLGFSGPVLAEAAKKAGVLCSLTTEAVLAHVDSDPFDWGRITAEESDSAATLAGKLTGWYATLKNTIAQFSNLIKSKKSTSLPSP